MKIGVPGEFHEDRWQRTAEDSERCMLPRTREVGETHRIQVIAWRRGTSGRSSARLPCPQVLQWHPRVAKGVFWLVFGTATMPTGAPEPSPRGEGGLLTGLRHGHPTHRYLSAISAWRRGSTGRSSARGPCPQVPQCHLGVAKGSPGRSSARPSVSIFGERGDTLRPARTSAYSAPGNTSHRSGARHIQWAPAYSESAWRFSRGRRRRGMNGQHIQ